MTGDRTHILSLTKKSLNNVKATFAAALDTDLNSDVLVEYLSAIRNLEDAVESLEEGDDNNGSSSDGDPEPKPSIFLDDDELVETNKARLPLVGLGVARFKTGILGSK